MQTFDEFWLTIKRDTNDDGETAKLVKQACECAWDRALLSAADACDITLNGKPMAANNAAVIDFHKCTKGRILSNTSNKKILIQPRDYHA